MRFCIYYLLTTVCICCYHTQVFTQPKIKKASFQLRFINSYELPFQTQFKNTTFGGLSGIDYDAKNNLYYLISDDRSAINPARFYTAQINISSTRIDTIIIKDVYSLLQANGMIFPNNKQNPLLTPDPEAIRYNPKNKSLVWTSEGDRNLNANVLVQPSITFIQTNGTFTDTCSLPTQLYINKEEKGPRQNGVLEGLTFANNYKFLYVNVEEPLYEDAPKADVTDNNPWIRFFKFNVRTKRNVAQFAYKLDPVAYPATPANAYKVNGVPDILEIGKNRFLVIERSFSTGRLPCTVKVFDVDMSEATNIINIPSLKNNTQFIAATKKLILNMDDLGIYTDNIEGVTFGPTLPNGNKTLLFVADNNFSPMQKNQFLLFEVMEK